MLTFWNLSGFENLGKVSKKNELTVNEFIVIRRKYQKEMELLKHNPQKKIVESNHY